MKQRSLGARGRRSRAARALLVPVLTAALLPACGDTRPARQPEGTVAFQSGGGSQRGSERYVVPGPPFQRPGMLVPTQEQVWQSAWIEREDPEHPLMQGARAGMTTGLGFLMIVPGALTFWPAAVGIMVGSTAAALWGVSQGDPADLRLSPSDRTVIVEATEALRPDRLFRESMREAVRTRAGNPLPVVAWQQPSSPEAGGTDPLVEARARNLDGVLEFAIDGLGLAAGEERDTFSVFVQVRARALDTHDGQLRYERVVGYGPGRTFEGIPRAEFHTVEFLAADQGRVYRQVASDAIRRLARVLAEDPQLPLPPPPKEEK